jgi:ketosteroid isomerase-like protein
MHRFLLFVFVVLINGFGLIACSGVEPVVDLEAEIGLVRAADRALLEAETNRDLDAALALIGEGVVLQPPDAPPVTGREAVRAFYADWFGIPYTGIYADSDKIVVSASGDLAYLIGNSRIDLDVSAGGDRLEGKYISLWQKVDGRWLCTGVSWSGNVPSG